MPEMLLGDGRAPGRWSQPVLVLRYNNTNLWINDPANPPIYAPDGLTGTARRAFNAVYVPYDPEKQTTGRSTRA